MFALGLAIGVVLAVGALLYFQVSSFELSRSQMPFKLRVQNIAFDGKFENIREFLPMKCLSTSTNNTWTSVDDEKMKLCDNLIAVGPKKFHFCALVMCYSSRNHIHFFWLAHHK